MHRAHGNRDIKRDNEEGRPARKEESWKLNNLRRKEKQHQMLMIEQVRR